MAGCWIEIVRDGSEAAWDDTEKVFRVYRCGIEWAVDLTTDTDPEFNDQLLYMGMKPA